MLPHQQLMRPEQEAAFGAALVDLVPADVVARCFQMAEVFAEHHPEEPLYYCQFLSTVPAFQGRGIGSMFCATCSDGPSRREAGVPRGDLTS